MSPKRYPSTIADEERVGSPSRTISPKRSSSKERVGSPSRMNVVDEEKIQTYHRLLEAIRSRNYIELEQLLKMGVDPNFYPMNSEFYPVIFETYDDSRAFELLIAYGASINVYRGPPSTMFNQSGHPLLYYFIYPLNVRYNRVKFSEYKNRIKDNEYNIRRLIELGADVNQPWNIYQNTLDYLVEKIIYEYISDEHGEYISDLLIRHGVDPNTKLNRRDYSVIFVYIDRQNPIIVEDLLRAGVDLNVLYNGKTPLQFTVDLITHNFNEQLYKILLLLIRYGQDIYQIVDGRPLIETLPPPIAERLVNDIQTPKEPGVN
jgi:hypothetical protein